MWWKPNKSIEKGDKMEIKERILLEKRLQKIENNEKRLIVRLREVHNMTYQQIGDLLGTDRTTVSRKYNDPLLSLEKRRC